MFRISEKIKIKNLSPNSEWTFRNEQINPSVSCSFKCCHCNFENEFIVTPYETGFSFTEIYEQEKVLTKKEILDNKIATETSSWASYLGYLTVDDLATLYFGTTCKKCQSKHLIVFSYGEKQPGLNLLKISGVWMYEM